jgi:hypothetical protein
VTAVASVRGGLLEGRRLWSALGEEPAAPKGALVVSGMLAEQLARELGAGAEPGAVLVREDPSVAGAEVIVRVIAGEPSADDAALVRAADTEEVPVVLVQLWPQADWKPPFVLSPFVVECRAGEGFPLREIADRIAEASERAPALAARVPVLEDSVREDVVRGSVVRAALLGMLRSGSRAGLALEQTYAIARLRTLEGSSSTATDDRALAGIAGLVYASGFAFRGAARRLSRGGLPTPLVDAAVAAGGTWLVARAASLLEDRLPTK